MSLTLFLFIHKQSHLVTIKGDTPLFKVLIISSLQFLCRYISSIYTMLICLYTMNISHNPENALLPFGPNPLLPHTLLMYCITFYNSLFLSVLQKAVSPFMYTQV